MKKLIGIAAAGAMLVALAGCAGGGGAASEGPKALDELVVGFAQVGAESGWRTANTKSIQDAFEEAGIELKFSDAQQKQENQIKAIRSYIQQKVDYRVLAGRRVRLGRGAQRGQGRRHPGRPDRPRRRLARTTRSTSRSSAPTSSRRARRPATGCSTSSRTHRDGQDRPARGHDGRRAGDRPGRGLRRRDPAEPEVQDRREPDRRLHPCRRQAGHGGAAEVQPRHRPRLRAQRRHGPRRDRGDRGGRPGAGRGHQDRHRRRRQGRHAGARRRQDQLHRGVLAAARPAADGHHQDGQRRRGRCEKRIITEETTFTQEQAIEALPDRQY